MVEEWEEKETFHVPSDEPGYCCAGPKNGSLCKLSGTALTPRQTVMLCVTRIPGKNKKTQKAIQKADSFIEKRIIRPFSGGCSVTLKLWRP